MEHESVSPERILRILVVFAIASGLGWSDSSLEKMEAMLFKQQAIIEAQAEAIKEQNQRIARLEARLEEIQEDTAINQEELEQVQEKNREAVHIHGYTQNTWRSINTSSSTVADSFDQGHTALFLQSKKGRLTFLTELEWAHSGSQVELERSWIEWEASKGLKIRAGQSFIPTWWNQHHYPHLTPGIQKPLLNRSILPLAYVGMAVSSGTYRSGRRIDMMAFTGNGIDTQTSGVPRIPSGLSGAGIDKDSSKAFGQKIELSLDPWNHLKLAALHYSDTRDFDYDGRPINGKGRYEAWQFEMDARRKRLALQASLGFGETQDSVLGERDIRAWYVMPSWGITEFLTAFVRLEKMNILDGIQTPLDQNRQVYGLNYRLRDDSGLKLEWLQSEYDSTLRADDEEFWASVYFAF